MDPPWPAARNRRAATAHPVTTGARLAVTRSMIWAGRAVWSAASRNRAALLTQPAGGRLGGPLVGRAAGHRAQPDRRRMLRYPAQGRLVQLDHDHRAAAGDQPL